MKGEQEALKSHTNWQILLDRDLDELKGDGLPLERPGLVIAPSQWALWCEDQSPTKGAKISSKSIAAHLKRNRGGGGSGGSKWFNNPTKKVRLYDDSGGRPVDKRVWFFGADEKTTVEEYAVYHPKASTRNGLGRWSLVTSLFGKNQDVIRTEEI